MRNPSCLIVLLALLVGCSNIAQVSTRTYPAVPVSHVEVLFSDPQRPYEVVALIKHDFELPFGSAKQEIETCRALAAKAGADAIVITSAENDTFQDTAKATGKAIRWKR